MLALVVPLAHTLLDFRGLAKGAMDNAASQKGKFSVGNFNTNLTIVERS